jgi:hypothetical protein
VNFVNHQEHLADDVRRMFNEASDRIHDADILSESMRESSDSSALLRVLGFEILLKCALTACRQRFKRSHRYADLWDGLPEDTQEKILAKARSRMPGHADLSDMPGLLRAYQYVWEQGRYFYEHYQGWQQDDVEAFGDLWIELGAREEDAEIAYFPNELRCLVFGLQAFIKGWLSRQEDAS